MSPYARARLAQPALTRDQERSLARLARAGDRHARERLIEAGTRWVVLHALRRRVTPDAFDDAVQDGTAGLIAAIDRYDPDRGVRLATFAWRWIDGAIARGERDRRHRLPDAEAASHPEQPIDGRDLLYRLEPIDAGILTARFGLDGAAPRTRAEIAAALSLSVGQVRRREERALIRLRRQLPGPDVGGACANC